MLMPVTRAKIRQSEILHDLIYRSLVWIYVLSGSLNRCFAPVMIDSVIPVFKSLFDFRC